MLTVNLSCQRAGRGQISQNVYDGAICLPAHDLPADNWQIP